MIRFTEFSNNETKLIKLKDSCSFFSGGTPSSSNKNYYTGNIPFIRSGEIHKNDTELKINENALNNSSAKMVNKGDLLLALYGATSGEIDISQINGAINQAILCIRPNDEINKYYLKYKLEYEKDNILKTYLQGGQGNLSAEIIKNLSYKFPSMNEQTKVSNFLSLLDKKIELQSKKIEDLKLFKSYTKNQLFSSGEKVVKLKDILIKWNERNKDGSIDYVESISNKYGFISQSDQFEDRNVASKDLKNYYVIRKNVFGYNPSRLNVGSLALKENDNTSVVSPLYECFTTTQNNKFMLEWFDSKYFKKGTLSKFEGGVRNTLNFTNLCEIEINLPTLDKQNEFANYLYNFDKKIQLEELKLNKLNEMKKGLMQSMFV